MYEPNYPYAGTSDGNSENIGVYGSQGSDGPGTVGGIDVSMFIIINDIIVLIKLWLTYQSIYQQNLYKCMNLIIRMLEHLTETRKI